MLNSAVVRPVYSADVPQLASLMLQYIADFYRQPDPGQEAVEQHIRYLLSHPLEGTQFVAEVEGEIVGFVTLYFTYSTLRLRRIAIMNDLFVTAGSRGKKVGETLFEAALAHAKSKECAWMQWETTRDNHTAQSLYTKMGGKTSDLLVYEIELFEA